MPAFDKLLVANRGEIACRILRTARALGLRTVAVHSDADAGAPHVGLADEAVRLGPGPAAESYLRIDAVIDAARRTGAQAVHPGYGFLSERAAFARACQQAGMVFVGPPAAAIEAMGDKAGAKRRMIEAGVPCAPGYLGEAQDEAAFAREAARLGFPLLVKAVAGGGGRGMRLVHAAGELPEALAGARREAESAFGDGTLMLERLVTGGRHIEVQVFADAHGHVIHLGERDCTSQRRRQKVIEESPSPVVPPALREAMGRDAVAAARAVGYVGAGTVEFILDGEGRHYFLEMNTRLQVEHPVTECVTGLDLVAWQLRVAAGEPLPLAQHEVRFDGHAIEARLCAEDPYEGFRPQAGNVRHWRPARAVAAGRGSVRIDDGVVEGQAVPPWYDAMVAKVIVHGRDRDDARRRLRRALEDAPLLGLATNGRYLRDLLDAPDFVAGAMTTTRLDEWAAAGTGPSARPLPSDDDWRVAAAVRAAGDAAAPDPGALGARVASRSLALRCGGEERRLRVRRVPLPRDDVAAGVVAMEVEDARGPAVLRLHPADADGWRAVECDGLRRRLLVLADGDAVTLVRDAAVHRFEEPSPVPASDASSDARAVRSPVAGTVARLRVQPGDRVAAGDPLVCVEAMKMEMWLAAGADGVVAEVHVIERAAVATGALLVSLAPDAPASP